MISCVNYVALEVFNFEKSIKNHANCVSFSENKILKLEKQEHMPIDNTWIKSNRTERKTKRFYAEVACNLEEVKVSHSVKRSRQPINIG